MEANETSEGPPATKDEKEQPSLKVPSTEDLPEATTHESPLHLSSSQNYLQSPEVHIKTYSSLDPDSKDSEDLQDPSVSETPLKLDTAKLPSTPFQLSPQSVTSLERATIEIPSENFVYENSISEVQEEPLQLSSTTTIPEHENPISEVQEELLEGTPTANTPEYENPISEVQEELLEGTPTANTPEYVNPISEVQEELLEGTPTAHTPEYENPISEVQEEPLEGTPTANTPEYENPISEVQEEPLEGTPTANTPEYENPISEVQEEPLEGTPTANIPEYENPISEVQEEPLEGTPTANTPEYENPIFEVQEELLEGTPTANTPEYENPISEVQEEPLEGTPTAHIPESSDELTSDKVPETQVPESEHFPKHSFSEPSAQAEEDEEDKEDAAANKEEAGEDELTGGTSNIAAARPQHHARKKKEKRAGGFASRPAVPAKRAELVEMAKAMHRKQFDDQVNNLFQWEKNSFLKAIQTGIYIGWRCPHYLWDCFRIGDESKCFCGHLLKEHQIISDLSVPCSVSQCRCLMFCFIPSRPEEVGEFWLKKRATFDPKAWRAQCRCKHTHEEHAATGAHPCRHRGCYCNSFESNFLCAACDRRWEEHETFFETEETRRRGKRPYGTSTVKNWHRPL